MSASPLRPDLTGFRRRLADSGLYEQSRKDALRDLLGRQSKLKQREAELEEAWMEALELLESMQAELEALS